MEVQPPQEQLGIQVLRVARVQQDPSVVMEVLQIRVLQEIQEIRDLVEIKVILVK
jgi:hypothetical protein